MNVAPPKNIFEDKPTVVNLSIFLLYFSSKIIAPNLRPITTFEIGEEFSVDIF
jgi:hypothetical protein